MTCSHCCRCWITLYMYKEDLLWVWREWGAWIIRTNRYPPPIPTTSTLRSEIANIRVWRHPYDHHSHCSRCWNLFYIYKEDLPWVWMAWGTSIIRTNRYPPPVPTTSTLMSQRAYIRLELHPYDHRSHCSRCWNLLYIYKEDLPWVWTGRGVSIMSTNRDSYLKAKQNILRSLGAH
jgi:hypothetical protein